MLGNSLQRIKINMVVILLGVCFQSLDVIIGRLLLIGQAAHKVSVLDHGELIQQHHDAVDVCNHLTTQRILGYSPHEATAELENQFPGDGKRNIQQLSNTHFLINLPFLKEVALYMTAFQTVCKTLHFVL